MRAGKLGSLVAGVVTSLSCLATGPAHAANTYATNPAGFDYDDSWRNFDAYKQPTALLITGRCNRDDDRFREARARGAEVLAYLNVIEMPDNRVCAMDWNFYTENGTTTPARWIGTNGQPRVNFHDQQMLNIRKGQAWSNHVVE